MEERKKVRLHEPENSAEMENREAGINTSRRRALKTIAAGSAIAGGLALGGKWTRPVVDTIILPAHAQATNAAPTTCNSYLAEVAFDVHENDNGFYDQPITVLGTVNPPVAGLTVQVHLCLWNDREGAWICTDYSPTTDATGAWSVTNTDFYDVCGARADVTGPCDDDDIRHIEELCPV